MKRAQLEHIIRAATTIADDHELVAAIRHGMVERETLFARLEQTDLEPKRRDFLSSLAELDFGEALRDGWSP